MQFIRKLLIVSAMIVGGCAVTLPAGDPFDVAMLEPPSSDQAILFVYSMPENQKAYYKHILIDGVHESTISNDTFARLVLPAGKHTVRVSQHGYRDRVELPTFFGLLSNPNPKLQALTDGSKDIEIEPASVNFISIHMKDRPIYYECGETNTATTVCSSQVSGVVIEETPRDTALLTLSSLREVCNACE